MHSFLDPEFRENCSKHSHSDLIGTRRYNPTWNLSDLTHEQVQEKIAIQKSFILEKSNYQIDYRSNYIRSCSIDNKLIDYDDYQFVKTAFIFIYAIITWSICRIIWDYFMLYKPNKVCFISGILFSDTEEFYSLYPQVECKDKASESFVPKVKQIPLF